MCLNKLISLIYKHFPNRPGCWLDRAWAVPGQLVVAFEVRRMIGRGRMYASQQGGVAFEELKDKDAAAAAAFLEARALAVIEELCRVRVGD